MNWCAFLTSWGSPSSHAGCLKLHKTVKGARDLLICTSMNRHKSTQEASTPDCGVVNSMCVFERC